jgi:hypothetical protein
MYHSKMTKVGITKDFQNRYGIDNKIVLTEGSKATRLTGGISQSWVSMFAAGKYFRHWVHLSQSVEGDVLTSSSSSVSSLS